MTTDPLHLRADTGETFTRKTLIVGILFQYMNELATEFIQQKTTGLDKQ